MQQLANLRLHVWLGPTALKPSNSSLPFITYSGFAMDRWDRIFALGREDIGREGGREGREMERELDCHEIYIMMQRVTRPASNGRGLLS